MKKERKGHYLYPGITTSTSELPRLQKYTATFRLDTSPVAKPFTIIQLFSLIPLIPKNTRPVLIPEFDLSVPAAGDDLGGLVRMPQGADAHLVVGFDPVVKLGGLPVPNVQLSVRVS